MSVEPNFGSESPSNLTPESSESHSPMPTPAEVANLRDVGAPVGAKTPAKEAASEEASKEPKKEIEAKKEEIKNLKRKFNLVVDGKAEDLELDMGNEEEIKKYLQKAKAADKRFEEAAQVRKAAMDFIEQLRKNPRRVLSDPNIGVDVKKFAEEILNEEILEMEKSPEQREREKLQRELEELKQASKDREEATKKADFERMQIEQERILETEISSALDIGGIPKTARTVKAMAEMMMIALENNIDLSPKDIAPIVKNTTLGEFKEIVSSLSDDQLEDFLGKEVIGRLRKKNVAKAKAVASASAIKPTGVQPKKEESSDKKNNKLSYRKFFGI